MHAPLNPEALLAALRDAGLRVGVGEVLRLQRVFQLQATATGRPGSAGLRSLLRAVLVKGRDDEAIFERVCDDWLADAEHEIAARAAAGAQAGSLAGAAAESAANETAAQRGARA
ncbi:hypothetical protein, partial [Accumulibacter sp.]|uniref:hypothetical protein n=1 Tax=Accumulibacter sp. TaxID=2053492 RepID=UPI002BA88408